jgi:hypothetical protein
LKKNLIIKVIPGLLFPVLFLLFAQTAFAQVPVSQQLPDTAQMTYNQISQSCNLFVYPSQGQSQQQQKEDEFECYKWAMEQSGVDPLNLPKVEATLQSGPTGGAVKGAARGAAAGAMRGMKQGKQAQAEQNQQSQANAAATEEEIKNTFIKAFSVCIEGKGYTI